MNNNNNNNNSLNIENDIQYSNSRSSSSSSSSSSSFSMCNMRDEKFASVALTAAQNSNMKYHQHGCVAVICGSIVARGWNTYGCQPNDEYCDNTCSCHAEIDVMRKLEKILLKKQLYMSKRNIRNCFLGRISMYVVRKDKYGNKYKDSAPCARCTRFMKSLNIKNLIYSNADGTLTKCRVRDYETTYISQGGQYIEQCMIDR